MQCWQSPTILVMVSLIAAIHAQQVPDAHHQQLEPVAKQSIGEQTDGLSPAATNQASSSSAASPPTPLRNAAWPRMAKRSWNKMQGVWGKRRADESAEEDDDQHEVKRGWSSLTQQGWGKRSWNQMYGAWGKRGNWNKMQGVWGKRSADDGEEDDDVAAMKRSNWNKMQGVWGKRSQEEDDGSFLPDEDEEQEKRAWNQLHGAWGKRSPAPMPHLDDEGDDDWNVIHQDEADSWTPGGKRGLSPLAAGYKRNWSNLRGSWGKREMPFALIAGKGNEWSRKRESGWNNLKGLWG